MAEHGGTLPELRQQLVTLQRELAHVQALCGALDKQCAELAARVGALEARPAEYAGRDDAPARIDRMTDTQTGLEPAKLTPLEIPSGNDWRQWHSAWTNATEHARALGAPLPDLQALWNACANPGERKARFVASLRAMDELEEWDDANRDSAPFFREPLKALFVWLRGERQELLNASPFHAHYRRLKNDFENALLARLSNTLDAAFVRALDELEQWRQFMDRERLWWDASVYDARAVRAVTDMYDLIVAETGDAAQRPLLGSIEAFLRPCGVRRDARLKLNVRHADLPPALQNHFQEDAAGGSNATTTAQSRVGRILHQRWYRVGADEREIGELTKPLYRFAF
jgi:hypothetical protein